MTVGSSDNFIRRVCDIVWRTAYARLITVNCMVFVALAAVHLVSHGTGATAVDWLAMPGRPGLLIQRPWTLVTYMFVNSDLFRLIFNMLWLLCFGRLLSLPLSAGRLVGLYLCGGLAGAVVFLCGSVCGWWPATWLVGPSAAVIAVTVATAMLLPKLEVNMLIIGNVKVVWVALCVLLIYFLDIDGANPGGNAAHVGGALGGLLFVLLRQHRVTRLLFRNTVKRKSKEAAGRKRGYNFGPKPDGDKIDPRDNVRLDAILDKVKRAGYGALSADEKAELFDISRRIK